MIDCLTCYRLHKHGGVIYCPFLGVNPCIRGEHQIGNAGEEEHRLKKKVVRHIAQVFPPAFYEYPPPAFKEVRSRGGGTVVDWRAYHDKIFELLREGHSAYAVSIRLNINSSTVMSYLRRYIPDDYEPPAPDSEKVE